MQGQEAADQGQHASREDDVAARLARVQQRYQTAQNATRRDDEEAHVDLLMRVGGENQWDPKAVQERRALGRPLYTANRFPATLAQITGEVRANPPAISCAPADSDATPAAAEVFEGLIRSIERVSQAQQAYVEAVEAAATCGRGHLRIAPVYADDESFDVELRIRPIRDVLSVKWDPMAMEFDKSDANWCIVVSQLDRKGFQEAYPDAGDAGWAAAKIAQRQIDGWHAGAGDKVTVAEEWEVQRIPYTRWRMAHVRPGVTFQNGVPVMAPPSGEEITIDGDPGAQTIDGVDAVLFLDQLRTEGFDVVQTRVAYKKKICMYLWGGSTELAGPIEWKGSRIPIFTVPGRQVFVDGQTVHEGVVRHARDAQRLHNWARSTDLEAVSQSAKSSPIVPEDAIEGFEDEWVAATKKPVPFRRYKAKPGIPAPTDGDPINSNPGPNNLANAGVLDFEDTTGVHAAALGKKSNETSGVAIAERDAQTDTGTFVFIFNLRAIVESVGRELVAAIPHYYSARKQIMILGQDDAPAIIELAQVRLDLGKYHVIAKTGPAYLTKREKSADVMMNMSKAAPPWAQPLIFMRVAKLLDLPDADEFIEEVRAVGAMVGALPQAPSPPQPMPQPGMGAPLPPNVTPFPQRGAPQGGDPLAGVDIPISPPRAPAARPVVGDAQMGAAPPGM